MPAAHVQNHHRKKILISIKRSRNEANEEENCLLLVSMSIIWPKPHVYEAHASTFAMLFFYARSMYMEDLSVYYHYHRYRWITENSRAIKLIACAHRTMHKLQAGKQAGAVLIKT